MRDKETRGRRSKVEGEGFGSIPRRDDRRRGEIEIKIN